MRVTVKALNKNAWSGIIQYKNCHTSLAPYFTRTGRLYTGLTPEDEKRLGEKLRMDLAPTSAFWLTFHIKMGAKDMELDTEDPYDELRYIFLKSHKRVANGLSDKKATANYVIINELEEAKESNKLSQLKRKALRELDKMTITDMRKCLRLFGFQSDDMNSDIVEQRLTDFVESEPNKFIEKWIENETKEIEYIIEEAISKNIIRKSKNIYRYGTDIIGHGLDQTIEFLESPTNSDIRTTIVNEIKAK
jgi:hypothetical protein